MLRLLFALLWLASTGPLAHAGGVTTTTTTTSTTTTLLSTTSTTVETTSTTSSSVATTSSTLVSTTTTSLPTSTTSTTVATTTTTIASTTTTSTTVSTTTSSSSSSSSSSTSTTSSSSTTSSTSTTVTTTTTTSTLPPPEQCGNCLDDDGDGRADFEDPECCGGSPEVLSIEQLELRANGIGTQLKLAASPLAGEASLFPMTHSVFVQLASEDGAPIFCASVDAIHFRGTRSKATFTDRTSGVPSAGGITSLQVQRVRSGPLRLKLRGDHAALVIPAPQTLRVAVALRSLVAPGNPTRCAAGFGDFE